MNFAAEQPPKSDSNANAPAQRNAARRSLTRLTFQQTRTAGRSIDAPPTLAPPPQPKFVEG